MVSMSVSSGGTRSWRNDQAKELTVAFFLNTLKDHPLGNAIVVSGPEPRKEFSCQTAFK
jgi:hypothetical protein